MTNPHRGVIHKTRKEMKPQMATIHDVANQAGVAISTVSNIINGTRYVSPETTEKVLAVIEELGYETDPIARSMKSGSTRMIGMIITSFKRVFFASLISRCREIALEKGYTLMCVETNDDVELEKYYINIMKNNRFDAIILNSVAEPDDEAYYGSICKLFIHGKHIPIACIEHDLTHYGLDSVEADNFDGAVSAVDHLASLGCKRIVHITGPTNSWPAERRVLGFSQAIAKYDNIEHKIIFGDFSPKSGYDAINCILAKEGALHFDAVFASNDQMAVGAMKALTQAGIHIPDEVKLIGFDDSFVTSLIDPPLTSVHVSGSHLGTEAMKMVFGRINGDKQPARCCKTETKLVIRGSSDAGASAEDSFSNW